MCRCIHTGSWVVCTGSMFGVSLFRATIFLWDCLSWIQQDYLSSKPWESSCPCFPEPGFWGRPPWPVLLCACRDYNSGKCLCGKDASAFFLVTRALTPYAPIAGSWGVGPILHMRKMKTMEGILQIRYSIFCLEVRCTLGIGFSLIKQIPSCLLSIIWSWAEIDGHPHVSSSVWY